MTFVDQGYTGEAAANAAAENGIKLVVIRLPDAKHGFVLRPRRWVVERSFAWLARLRRLVRDCERLLDLLVDSDLIALGTTMLERLIAL